MKVLLDSHALLWFLSESNDLTPPALEAIRDPENYVFVSVASLWELSIKHGLGKLLLPNSPEEFFEGEIEKNTLNVLPITQAHAYVAGQLSSSVHRDPFDRMLAAQALVEKSRVVSADVSFDSYGVDRIW
jgi:PIN domain nuclease of toxin-antitoxin system